VDRLAAHSCDRAVAQISLRLDGELSPFEEAELRGHLAGCLTCATYAQEAESFTSVMRATPSERFDMQIVMPRRHRLALRPLQVGAAAAMVAVVGLGGLLGLGRSGGPLSSSIGISNQSRPDAARPAYLDSASYELRIIRRMTSTHAPGGSAVPQ